MSSAKFPPTSTAKRSSWVRRLLAAGARRPDLKHASSISKLLPQDEGPPAPELRNLRLEGSSRIVAGYSSSTGTYRTWTLDLDTQLGNHNGHFSVFGKNFSASARNVRLQGLRLVAELKQLSGDWSADEIYLGWLSEGWQLDPDHLVNHTMAIPCAPTLYGPLSVTQEQFRLCYINPGSWHDTLVCSLQTRSLHEARDYACLSYVWGSASKQIKITLDSREVSITNNLAVALKRLRWHGMTVPIWIDALCINQSDVDERNAQVALMPQIYSRASLVAIRMNVSTSDSDLLARYGLDHQWLWSMVSAFIRCIAKDVPLNVGVRAALEIIIARTTISSTPHALLPLLTDALHRCASSSWFDRAWTLQEYLLTDNAALMFHTEVLNARTLLLAFEAMGRRANGLIYERLTFEQYLAIDPSADAETFPAMNHDFFRSVNALFNTVKHIHEIKIIKRNSDAIPNTHLAFAPWKIDFNLTILHSARRKLASDPRDKLFAFISLADNVFGSAPPDYARSVDEIYLSFTVNTISYMGNFDLWCFIKQDENPSSGIHASCPSWVVDWTVPGDDCERFQYWQKHKTVYEQMETFALWGSPVVNLSGNVLTIRGVQSDTLHAVSSDVLAIGTLPDLPNGRDLLDWLQFAGMQQVSDIARSPNLWAAFWRTLVGERFPRSPGDLWQFTPGRRNMHWTVPTSTHGKQLQRLMKVASAHPNERVKTPSEPLQFLLNVITRNCQGRKLFRTADGRLGLCPLSARLGDCVFYIAGSRWPVLLRPYPLPRRGESHPEVMYTLVGLCHVQGVERGAILKLLRGVHFVHIC